MSDEDQFLEYQGSLLACERAVIRRDLRVGLILGANGGPYPFPTGGAREYAYQSGTINPISAQFTTLVQTGPEFLATVGERVKLQGMTTLFAGQPFPVPGAPLQATVIIGKDPALAPPFGTVLAVSRWAVWPPPAGSQGFEFTCAPMATDIGDGAPHAYALILSVDLAVATWGIAVTGGAAGSALHGTIGPNNQ